MLRPLCRLLPWLVVLVLVGCASVTPPPPPVGDAAGLERWRIDGKLGYRSPQESGSAWLDWRQDGKRFDLFLRGPLGVGATRISGDASGAVLQRGGEDDVRARSASELTAWLLGLSLPVEQLADWVKGVPARSPRPARVEFGDGGHLVLLEQGGWTLRYDRQRAVGDLVLPGRIRGQKGELSFTLVIGEWSLAPSPKPESP